MNIIKLNIGGQHIQVTCDILKNMTYFDSYLERWNNQEELFIDCDYELFRHLLNIYRIPEYIVPKDLTININKLIKYYGANIKISHQIKTLNYFKINLYKYYNQHLNIISGGIIEGISFKGIKRIHTRYRDKDMDLNTINILSLRTNECTNIDIEDIVSEKEIQLKYYYNIIDKEVHSIFEHPSYIIEALNGTNNNVMTFIAEEIITVKLKVTIIDPKLKTKSYELIE